MSDFFRGTTPELRVGFFAFVVGLVGVGLGFLGFAIEVRWLSILGYCVVALSVSTGFGGIALGWVRIIQQIIKGIFK